MKNKQRLATAKMLAYKYGMNNIDTWRFFDDFILVTGVEEGSRVTLSVADNGDVTEYYR